MSALAPLDVWLFRAGNAAGAAAWLDAFFVWLTAPPARALWLAGLAVAIGGLGGRRGRAAVLLAALAVGLADLAAAELLKPGLDRLRPCFALPEAALLLPRQAHSPSFPSSHAANAFAAAFLLCRVSRALGAAAVVAAGLIAYSRVYVGVHYPSDLLGGALLGTAVSLALGPLHPATTRWLAWLEAGVWSRFRSRSGSNRPIT
jgi:undecaprenyl-diphosphatase